MKTAKLFLPLLLLTATLGANPALAQHGRHHGGGASVGVGIYLNPWPLYYAGPRYAPYYPTYPYPPYYPDTTLVVTQPPVVYVERGSAPAGSAPEYSQPTQASGDWYYCHNPDGYYPYVKNCPAGWERVPSQPAPQR